jgi:hypothetical protein
MKLLNVMGTMFLLDKKKKFWYSMTQQGEYN